MTAEELIHLQPALRRVAGGDDDVLQETNLKLWEKRATIRDPSRYCLRVASRIRRKARTNLTALAMDLAEAHDLITSPAQSPVSILCQQESLDQLPSAIRQLPPRQHAAISRRLQTDNNHEHDMTSSVSLNSAGFKALRNLRRILKTAS